MPRLRTKTNPADRRPTWTSRFVAALRDRDDFMSLPQLMEATGANGDQARATLYHLKAQRVVDVIEAEGALWWFLTGEDQRSRTIEERAPEPTGNRSRQGTRRRSRPPREE